MPTPDDCLTNSAAAFALEPDFRGEDADLRFRCTAALPNSGMGVGK